MEGGELISGRLFSVLAFVITRLVNGDPLWSRGITENNLLSRQRFGCGEDFSKATEVAELVDWRGGTVFVCVSRFDTAL